MSLLLFDFVGRLKLILTEVEKYKDISVFLFHEKYRCPIFLI